jgi:4-diphosphocytidyl-2C-methyl-D-erythritol kinase
MRLLIAKDVIFEEVDDQVVLLSLEGGRYYKLNGSGSRVWALIKEHGELQKVQDAMAEEFDADEAEVRRDVATLIADLEAHGLVEVSELAT